MRVGHDYGSVQLPSKSHEVEYQNALVSLTSCAIQCLHTLQRKGFKKIDNKKRCGTYKSNFKFSNAFLPRFRKGFLRNILQCCQVNPPNQLRIWELHQWNGNLKCVPIKAINGNSNFSKDTHQTSQRITKSLPHTDAIPLNVIARDASHVCETRYNRCGNYKSFFKF